MGNFSKMAPSTFCLKEMTIHFANGDKNESYNTNVWDEVKINEARQDLFFDHHVTLCGHFFLKLPVYQFIAMNKQSN